MMLPFDRLRVFSVCPRARSTALAAAALILASIPLNADKMPALNTPSTTEHLVGKFEWADLFTNNPEAEAKFYTQLFDWTEKTVTKKGHSYILISNGSDTIAGIVQSSKKHSDDSLPRWVGFAATDNIEKAAAEITKDGGKILAKPRSIADRGTQAIAADQEGAVFGLIQSTSGDAPDYQPSSGDLAWAELFSANPKTAADFYSKTFSYQSSVDPAHGDQEHLILAAGEFARAGISSSPPWEGGKGDWLLFICVSDVAATAKKAAQLGGTVLVAPHDSKHGGQVAVLADPLGGVIGILELETANTLKATP